MIYHRPKTRGELKTKLQEGQTCEVAGSVEESTRICFTGWLNFKAFSTMPSPNRGWVLFIPRENVDMVMGV
jgi:hypothetical protein